MPPTSSRKKNKFYAVAVGRRPGIYESWDECKEQTQKFKAAKFKSFDKMSEAQEFVDTYKIQTITASASVEVKEVVDQGRPSKRPRRETTHTISIWIHFDGGSRGNPGLGGAGAQVVVSKVTPNQSTPTSGKILHVRKYLGKHGVTNNQAEYHGLLAGLEETLSQVQTFVTESGVNSGNAPVFAAKIKVKGDSDLILQQVKGEYKVRSDKLVGLHKNVHKVVSQIKSLASVEIDYDHVFRAENAVADGLANEAMDSEKSWTSVVANRKYDEPENAIPSTAIKGGIDV